MQLAYICSPFSGPFMDFNIWTARCMCRMALEEGYLPYAPHLLFPQFLDDNRPEDRSLGIKCGLEMLDRSDELWIYLGTHDKIEDALSVGMRIEYANWAEEKPIRLISGDQLHRRKFENESGIVQSLYPICCAPGINPPSTEGGHPVPPRL